MNVFGPPHIDEASLVTSLEELQRLYGEPHPMAARKQIDHVDARAADFIAASPFLVMATVGDGGLDCSPKGDQAGFVDVANARTLLIPDRPGNNRLDGFRNILSQPAVGLIFFIPRMAETLRVNGRAKISIQPDLCARFARSGTPARSVVIVQVEEVFLHCGRALVHAGLWRHEGWLSAETLPSVREIFEAHLALNAADSGGLD